MEDQFAKTGNALPDVIFVSLEDWDEVWRRNQFICYGLARRFPDTKILFVGLTRDVSHAVRRGDWGTVRKTALWPVPEQPNITILQPLKLLPNTISWGRRFNEWFLRVQVYRAARSLSLRRPVLWLNPHYAVHMAGRMDECAVIYDITDDWISLTQSDRRRRLVTSQDRALCRLADTVIVCSPHLLEMKRDLARSLHLIPNGVDTKHYQHVNQPGAMPVETADWTRPVFGYTGTIHPERVDVPLIEALARHFAGGTIALIGPNMLPPLQDAMLRAVGNIQFTGPVPYAKVPEYMRAFDVCMTPHRMTPFTESLNPIKLWEYLACGKPIASTNVAGFRDYPQFVHLASNHAEFIEACQNALVEDPALSAARMAEAGNHSWDERLEQVQSIIQELAQRH